MFLHYKQILRGGSWGSAVHQGMWAQQNVNRKLGTGSQEQQSAGCGVQGMGRIWNLLVAGKAVTHIFLLRFELNVALARDKQI